MYSLTIWLIQSWITGPRRCLAATSLERDVGWVEVSLGGHAINISHRLYTTWAQEHSAVNVQSTNCIPFLPTFSRQWMRHNHTHFLKDTNNIADTHVQTQDFPACLHRAAWEKSPDENSNCNKGLSANHQTEGKTQGAVSRLIKSHRSWNPVLMLQRPSCSLTHPSVEVLLSVGTATPHPGKASLHSTTWRGWSPRNTARPHPVQLLPTNRDHSELLIRIT